MDNVLSSLAFLDAKHDFQDYAEMYRSSILDSLPGAIVDIKDEEQALMEAAEYSESLQCVEASRPNEVFQLLGGSPSRPVGIVCDALFCGDIITILKQNTIGQVYYILNREVLNDPGRHSIPAESRSLYVARDTDNRPILYDRHTDQSNSLYSLFDVRLEYDQNTVTCTTSYNGSDVEVAQESSNNEVSSVLETIVLAPNTQTIQSAFLRKRAGDWLQVLSCIDDTRVYTVNGQSKNLKDCAVYFCTSDRIAFAFALYNNINSILKRDNTFIMYKSRGRRAAKPSHLSGQPLFFYRREHADEYASVLKDGLETYNAIKQDFTSKISGVSDISSLDELKRILVVAMRYYDLLSQYNAGVVYDIQKFVDNPMDPYFEEGRYYASVNYAIDHNFDEIMRKKKHLSPYDFSEEEKFYRTFSFQNVSLDSPDILYGCSIFRCMLRFEELHSFVHDAMNKVIELTNYDVHVIALYSRIVESRNMSGRDEHLQTGGYRSSTDVLTRLGNYLTYHLVNPGIVPHSMVLGPSNFTINHKTVCRDFTEWLVYKKGIVPKGYPAYVNYVNSYYEPGEGPMEDMAQFLKRLVRPLRNKTIKHKHNHKLPAYVVARRKKSVRRRRRA